MRFDTNDIIAALKRKISIPTTQSLFSNSDFVALADEALHISVVPLIQSVVEEYFVHTEDFTVTPDSNYIEIPAEASGLRLREIYETDQLNGTVQSAVRRINYESMGSRYLTGFYLQNSKVMFYPQPSAAHYYRLVFYKSPNHLVEVVKGGAVTAVAPLTGIITLTSTPDWVVGNTLDVIIPTLPFNLRKENITIVSKTGFDITLSTADVADIAVGDMVYLSNEAPVAQYIPSEAWFLLVQVAAIRVLEALNDANALKAAWATYSEMKKNLMILINPRITGQNKKITKSR